MITLVGGTFNCIHIGHKRLLRTAISFKDDLIIGLTSDDYTRKNKSYKIPYEKRKMELERFISKYTERFIIRPIDSPYGSTLEVNEPARIVVSPETYLNALKINERRAELGLMPINIVRVPFVLAEDLFPVSSTRILNNEITKTGKRKKTIKISISTGNDVKERALKVFLSNHMKNFRVTRNSDYKLEAEQPFGSDTERFAVKRALSGLKDNDYSVGVESGLYYNKINDRYYDVHFCAVIDRYGRITTGYSRGFEIPYKIVDYIKSGVSSPYEKYTGIENIGKKNGIIGEITFNKIRRFDLIYDSIEMAFAPRINPSIYI
ncbi:bifunctional pantetheine-phosphate adenylyltransferase/NTP phosphatase [Picrophilus oshimae]|uniref:Phosphopantetheine adenylyltransferase n=1 Tax=Picrophilus torridus (strain ATCC 700027 / DSM 9790 / JCM 10055 / NBRC 100828 / KAW 2/3) TaxID=1122961 RepID=A0A8G2L7S5_PICTO|nr:bifunctional pantetheine-phosphate adenylyltransferase/NTP phosphatase [Picrophilus oshimae]SMD30600.1 pantetheine-phosphate adenylyltransferase [Picrophilus oshimae DSM 9789]